MLKLCVGGFVVVHTEGWGGGGGREIIEGACSWWKRVETAKGFS